MTVTRLDEKESAAVSAVAVWLLERDGRPPYLIHTRTGYDYRCRAAALLAGEAWAQVRTPINSTAP